MRLPPEFPEDDDDSLCRLVASIILTGGFFLAMAILIFGFTSCSSQFYYPDGTIKARVMGDLTYSKSAKGDETFALKHSPVIRAGGIATTQGIAAAGSAASAVMLSRP